MLHELRVENLLLMERAELQLAPGLNVLTGETGAGKTLLAHALDLLLGGRARSGIVRAGASEAYVEGVFARPPELPEGVAERIPGDAEEVVLARRVWPDGRTRAYVCGRSATLSDLRELGGALLAFYGQHEHRKLMLGAAQLEILDGHCGPEASTLRSRIAGAYLRARDGAARVRELRERAAVRERELDLVAFELEEIEAADPQEGEDTELVAERDRLRHLETLRGAAGTAAEALAPDDGVGVAELAASGASPLESAAAIDPALTPLAERCIALSYEASDLAAELRRYGERIEGPPGRLEEVEERLGILSRLARKHGGTLSAVRAHAEGCRARLAELQGAGDALAAAEAELAGAERELAALAAQLRERRAAAAPRLAAAVRERLAELAMADARFEVELGERPGGCGPRGADTVELMIAPNPGTPIGSLRETASGGELSRVMLALLSVVHGEAARSAPAATAAAGEAGGDQPLLVFDEIDAGIGGHTARAVGEHLRALSAGRQVLCITHLPQVAALADRHFTIVKDTSRELAVTTVEGIADDRVLDELVRMLGAAPEDQAARRHAQQLRRASGGVRRLLRAA